MPRVVPSQIVRYIDSLQVREMSPGVVSMNSLDPAMLDGLLDLVNQVPDELHTMDGDGYSYLTYAKAQIKNVLATWTQNRMAGHQLQLFTFSASKGPLAKIREVFAKCADEAPVPGTSELGFITGQDAFRKNLRNDIGAVYRALANGEWKAATVLAGSAAEALLLWALKQRSTADITVAIQALKLRNELSTNPDPPHLDRWNLYEFIQVAEELHLIRTNTAKQTRLAKDFRNFIHPGVAQRLGEKCDRATAFSAVAGMEHVIRDLTV